MRLRLDLSDRFEDGNMIRIVTRSVLKKRIHPVESPKWIHPQKTSPKDPDPVRFPENGPLPDLPVRIAAQMSYGLFREPDAVRGRDGIRLWRANPFPDKKDLP